VKLKAAAALTAMMIAGLTACGGDDDTTKKACQSWKDESFDSVVGPLYDGASDSFKRLYDKIDDADGTGGLGYYMDITDLATLCSKYGVKNADASMG
jgi:hypothetical protein